MVRKQSPQTRRARSHGERAVSPVIGVLLLLAIAMILVATLQTTAIPQLNAQHEFQHNQEAQADIVRLESTTDRVAALGNGETTTVSVGLRYPPRILFINPPPVSGTVETTGQRPVTISNAVAAGETGDYWNGTTRRFETTTVVYRPAYNEYDGAPRTVYEPWAVYNKDRNQTLPLAPSDLVDGRRISIVSIDGTLSESRAGLASLDVRPNSAPVNVVTVRNETGPLTISVPTSLRRDTLLELLEEELDDPTADDEAYVTGVSCQRQPPAPCGTLTLTFEPGTYELALGEIAVGSGASREPAVYLTDVEGNSTSVQASGRQRLVVEARDRFDNPVSGVSVRGEVQQGPGNLRQVTPTTQSDGRAVFVYEAPPDVTDPQPVSVVTQFGPADAQRTVSFDLRVAGTTTSRAADGRSNPSINALTITDTSKTDGTPKYVQFDVDYAVSSDVELAEIRLTAVRQSDGAEISNVTRNLSGATASGVETIRGPDQNRQLQGSSYDITVTVTDARGRVTSEERTVTIS